MSSQPEDIFTWRTRELKRWWFGTDQEERESALNSKNQRPKPKLPPLAEVAAWKDSVIASIEASSNSQDSASKKPKIPTGPEVHSGALKRNRVIHPSAFKVYNQLNGAGR